MFNKINFESLRNIGSSVMTTARGSVAPENRKTALFGAAAGFLATVVVKAIVTRIRGSK